MISIDGDTSTNDMVTLLASGLAGNKEINNSGDDYETFVNALYAVMMNLSRELARDGEGATKLLECAVNGAPDDLTARKIPPNPLLPPRFSNPPCSALMQTGADPLCDWLYRCGF